MDLPLNKSKKEKRNHDHLSPFFLLIYINGITRFSFLFNFQYTHQTKCHHASIKKKHKNLHRHFLLTYFTTYIFHFQLNILSLILTLYKEKIFFFKDYLYF